MQNNINYAALSMNDIIFQGRNKDYGAYELRESYNRRIKRAMLATLFLTGFLCSYQTLLSMYHPIAQKPDLIISCGFSDIKPPVLEAIKPPKIQPPKPSGTTNPPTVAAAAILVPKNTDKATDSVPTNDMLAHAAISDITKDGTTPGTVIGVTTPDAGTLAIAVKAPPKTVNYAEFMPEYPGGEDAMMAFLGKTLEYPDPDKEMGIEGKVTVEFVVDENGKPTDVRVMKGLSRTLDQESIRVVSKLKTFKPGMQGGHPVRVRMILPISYKLRNS